MIGRVGQRRCKGLVARQPHDVHPTSRPIDPPDQEFCVGNDTKSPLPKNPPNPEHYDEKKSTSVENQVDHFAFVIFGDSRSFP